MAREYDLSAILRVIDQSTKPLQKIAQGYEKLKKPIDAVDKRIRETGKSFKEMGDKISSVGQKMALKVTLPLTILGGIATRTAIKFEDAWIGVTKTVDGTQQQLLSLKKELIDLATKIPVPVEKLMNIAETAGQLAIERENIRDFTKVIADLGVAAPTLEMTEAATQLAQFANITQMSQKDFEKLASTIVDLGNNTATTENKILDMTMRLAGAGNLVGLTQPQIVSIAAGLAQLGIEAEMGGSAFSQVMMRINKEIGKNSKEVQGFAAVSGKTVKQFEKDWKGKPIESLLTFIEGLKKLEQKGINVNQVLDALGMDGIRIADTLLRASGAGDKFRDVIQRGNNAWNENVALTVEANKRYASMSSQLTILKNKVLIMASAYGEILAKALIKLLKWLEPVVNWMKELSPTTKTVIVVVTTLVAILGPFLMMIGFLVSGIGGLITAFSFLTVTLIPMLPLLLAISLAITGIGLAIWQINKNGKGALEGITLMFKDFYQTLVDIHDVVRRMFPDWLKKKMGIPVVGEMNLTAGQKYSYEHGSIDVKRNIEAMVKNNTQTDVNIKVTTDGNSTATIEDVKKKGDANVNISTLGYVGAF